MGVIWGELKFNLILCVVYISFRQRKSGKVYFTVSYRLYSPGHSLYDIKNTNVNMVFY